MRVLVTGASGFVGSSVVPELVSAGHHVVGLARSDAAAAKLAATGIEVVRGDLDDISSIRAGAAKADGVIHLAFNHDFTKMAENAQAEQRAIEAIGLELEGSNRPFVLASGMLGIKPGHLVTEDDWPATALSPRLAGQMLALDFAKRGVRTSFVRLSPTTHGPNDHGFMAFIVKCARDHGVAGYLGDGANRWPAVHVRDAARLFRLALEKAPAGTAVHAVGDEGVPIRTIAEIIGRHLKLPVQSVAPEHFSWMARFIGIDSPASNQRTRERLDWTPTHPTLVEDLEAGLYW